MMVWLEDIPPTLVVGNKPCVRCRSLLKLRYEDIAANCAVASHVPLLDVFCDYCSDDEDDIYFPRQLKLETRLLVDGMLEPVLKEHGIDMRYLPFVNKYPERLRPHFTKLLCPLVNKLPRGGMGPRRTSLQTVELPDSIFDGVHDPWVVLGTIASAIGDDNCADEDLHDDDWHAFFSSFLRCCLECFDLPALPELSSRSIRLCREITREYAEQRPFRQFHTGWDDSDWVYSGQGHSQLPLSSAVMAAVATSLRNRGVELYGCRRCQDICMESFCCTSSANSAEHEGLGHPSAYVRGEGNTPGGSHSSSLQKRLVVGMQEPVGMEAFTTYLRDPTLSKDEVQLRMVAGFLKLRRYLEFCGLDASDCFHRSDGGGLGNLPDHGIFSSKLSKSDKVEKIKDKLLEMLREHNLPYERLPWYTLEKDLKKHGCTLVNWPVGVLRTCENRTIDDLSAFEVNSLYEAITCPDESRRLRICRCSTTSTVVPVQQVDHTSAAASGSKRRVEELDSARQPSKRIRTEDMTSKVSQEHLSDPRADGPSDS
ncbi:hypothetical protein EDD15DRAFT_2232124 [Pisolithus albus]|nr:hypothetical protein EDD15DRAFT_2232124 [Pisolithus albus]